MDALVFDLRFALRSLARRRTFAAIALATIALSIGAATSIYSVVDGVLFRALPYHDPGRLVAIWQTDTARKKQPLLAARWDIVPLDYTDYLVWRAKQRSFTGIGVWSGASIMLDGPNGPEQLIGKRVSPGLFEALGVKPILGRTFLPGEDVVGGPRVTMLSYDTWLSRFGGRRDILGRTVRFDDTPYTIIGVLPKGFTLERGQPGAPFWIPAGQGRGDVGHHNRGFSAIGRLAPGVSLEQATVETEHLLNATTPTSPKGVRITDYVREETRNVRTPLLILLGAVGLLLVIACVNIATLLLGEAAARETEMAARVALGASRMRLVRQLLTESLLLSTVGGACGALIAWWGTKAIVALAPDRLPGIHAVRVDARVLAAALVAAGVTGVLFGLVPALTSSDVGPASILRAGATVRGRGRLQRTMIATELALSVVLLVGAGLFSRSLKRLTEVDPGFRTDHLLAVRLSFPRHALDDSLRFRGLYDQLLARLRATPGVVAATAVSAVPFSGSSSSSPLLLPGEDERVFSERTHEAQQRTVDPGYFGTMGIPLLAGRAFDASDRGGATPVAIVSEAEARRDFPNTSAVGQRVRHQGQWRTIVGVVGDIKFQELSSPDEATIYTPFAQDLDALALMVRTRADPAAFAPAVRQLLRHEAPKVAIANVDVMDDLVAHTFSDERFRTALIGVFGLMAGVLAVVGMYGVTARAVSRRTREVGVRVALGATASSVVAMIVRQTLGSVAVGVVIGIGIASAASRVAAPYLFGVTTHDPATYAGIVALLAVVSVAASCVPARRAGHVEPAVVLRGE